jgi:hypothetical protein
MIVIWLIDATRIGEAMGCKYPYPKIPGDGSKGMSHP